MLISTTIFLFFLFLTYALFLLASRKSDARYSRLQQRVAEALQDSENTTQEPVQISRGDSIGGSETINKLLSSLDFVKKLDQMIGQADVHITVSRLLTFSLLAGIMAALAAFTLFNIVPVVVIFFLAAAWEAAERAAPFA